MVPLCADWGGADHLRLTRRRIICSSSSFLHVQHTRSCQAHRDQPSAIFRPPACARRRVRYLFSGPSDFWIAGFAQAQSVPSYQVPESIDREIHLTGDVIGLCTRIFPSRYPQGCWSVVHFLTVGPLIAQACMTRPAGGSVKNTQFHKTGTSLGCVDYFPYRQALPADRRTRGAVCGAHARLQQALRVGETALAGFESKIVEAEQRRDKFNRIAPGWSQAHEALQQLVQAYHAKKREVAELAAALAEEEQREARPRTFELWDAVAQPDYQHLNYMRERVDVRKTNYFVQDNRGQLVENVYLPDMEPRSPRRSTWIAHNPPPQGSAAAHGEQFGLWVPNPTFHKPVRKREGHWFGAGGLPGDTLARFLEQRRSELTEAPAARFLLRRRPDVLGSIPWQELGARPLQTGSTRPQSQSVEAMLTARRGYVPLAPAQAQPGKRQRQRLDPDLLPTGSPEALDELRSPVCAALKLASLCAAVCCLAIARKRACALDLKLLEHQKTRTVCQHNQGK